MVIKKKLNSAAQFIKSDIWHKDFAHLSSIKRFLINIVRMCVIVTKGFFEDDLPLMSSALTFATILGMVPFLALMFSILKSFGVHASIETAIINKMAMGSQELVATIFGYINQINAKSIGAAGLAILVFTVLYVVTNVELSFNRIWGVRRKRGFFRSFSDYLSVILVGPVFVFAAFSLTTSVQAEGTFLMDKIISFGIFPSFVLTIKNLYPKIFSLMPFVFMYGFFIFIYSFIPNTKVKISAAALGGIVGATLWQLASAAYINFQIGLAKYGAIYGSMAQLPTLLLWIYLSWIIILFGAEVSFAFQNLKTFGFESGSLSLSHEYKEMLALKVSLLVAANFETGSKMNSSEIAGKLNVPLRLVNQIFYELSSTNIFVETAKEKGVYVPARDLEKIKIIDIINALRSFGGGMLPDGNTPYSEYTAVMKRSMDEGLSQALSGKTLKDAANGIKNTP